MYGLGTSHGSLGIPSLHLIFCVHPSVVKKIKEMCIWSHRSKLILFESQPMGLTIYSSFLLKVKAAEIIPSGMSCNDTS